MAIYDNKPLIYGANGNGSYTYRWNITEIEVPTGHEPDTTIKKWQCNEVIVWRTVTKDKLTDTVMNHLWSKDYEQKLINDYNAAKEGVFGDLTGISAQSYITRYKEFLMQRKTIKEQIVADCELLNIYNFDL